MSAPNIIKDILSHHASEHCGMILDDEGIAVLADALSARPAGQVVKPLDFEKHPDEQEWYSITYEDGDVAEFGYMVLPCKKSKFCVYTISNGKKRKIGKPFILADDAMAFANSVHSFRTLSALTTQPTTYDEAFAAGRDAGLVAAARVAVIPCYVARHVTLGDKVRDRIHALRNQPQGDDE